jgi:hypothetical protein
MEDTPSQNEQAQIERAKRLRQKISDLKSGITESTPGQPKSIKEQIAEREREIEKQSE